MQIVRNVCGGVQPEMDKMISSICICIAVRGVELHQCTHTWIFLFYEWNGHSDYNITIKNS